MCISRTLDTSVIIPAYNASLWVGRAIESILQQTVRVREIIVIDDGSTDGTGKVVQQYAPHVHYIYQENLGVAAAWNRGVSAATGEWVGFLGADDEWLPRKLEVQLRGLCKQPSMLWCMCNVEIVSGSVKHLYPTMIEQAQEVDMFGSTVGNMWLHMGALIVHRLAVERIGGFDTTLRTGEDLDWCWRLGMRYPKGVYVPEAGYRYYTDTPGSLTKVGSDRNHVIDMLCRNIVRARTCDVQNDSGDRYLRHVAISYLYRRAAREVHFSAECADRLTRVAGCGRLSQAVCKGLCLLPSKWAQKVADMLVEVHEKYV